MPQHDATRCLLSLATTLHKTQEYAETNTPLDAQQLGNSLTDATHTSEEVALTGQQTEFIVSMVNV